MKRIPTVADAGSLGGKARAKKLTPERRSEIARNAINTRWVMAELGRRGGVAKNKAMTSQERSELAKKAARSRWNQNGAAPESVPSEPSGRTTKRKKDRPV